MLEEFSHRDCWWPDRSDANTGFASLEMALRKLQILPKFCVISVNGLLKHTACNPTLVCHLLYVKVLTHFPVSLFLFFNFYDC